MNAIIIVTIVFTAIVLALAIVSGTILAAMRLRRGGFRPSDKALNDEETRLIQQMHDDLTKMEARIEALETILMEDSGKDRQ